MKLYKSGHYSGQLYDLSHYHPTPPKHEKGAVPEKKFPITRKLKLTYMSRAIELFQNSTYEPYSQILTYRSNPTCNPWADFNRYKTNMTKNHGWKSYIAALEVGEKGGLFHFHLMVDAPKMHPHEICEKWCNAANRDYTNNAVRDVRTIKSELAAIKYCVDYYSKKGSKNHKHRKLTCSRHLSGSESIEIDNHVWKKMMMSGYIASISEFNTDFTVGGRLFLDEKVTKLFQ